MGIGTGRLIIHALRTLKGIFPLICIAVSCFCLLAAGNVYATVKGEKSAPCELVVSSSEFITQETFQQCAQLDGVVAITAVMDIPAELNLDQYTAQLTLTGMDASYLSETYLTGGVYPDSTVMPYIVLNKCAVRLFAGDDQSNIPEGADLEQLNEAEVIIQGQSVVARICGVIDDESDQPRGHISLNQARLLSGNNNYSTMLIRVQDTGIGESVKDTLAQMGLDAQADGSFAERWEVLSLHQTYLFIIGMVLLICGYTFILHLGKIQMQSSDNIMLLASGFTARDIVRLIRMRRFITASLGCLLGISALLIIQFFLNRESILSYPIDLIALLITVGVCISPGILPVQQRL